MVSTATRSTVTNCSPLETKMRMVLITTATVWYVSFTHSYNTLFISPIDNIQVHADNMLTKDFEVTERSETCACSYSASNQR